MAKHYKNENQVKEALKIDSYSQITKDKAPEFASYLCKMEPEVAKKALDQVPEYALTVREALKGIQVVIEKGLQSNNESMRLFCEMAERDSESLRQQLDKENLTENERTMITDRLINILTMVSDKDTENKRFILENIAIYVGSAFSVVGLVFLGYSLANRKL